MGLNKRLIDQVGGAGGGLGNPNDNFDIVTYTGNGSTQTISSLNFQPDLVISKSRSFYEKWNVFDSIRGATKRLYIDGTHAEATQTNSLTSFNSNGYSIGAWADINTNNATFVSYSFKGGGAAVSNTDGGVTTSVSANVNAGFSVIKYNGSGGGPSTGTGLLSPVEFMIVKRYTTVQEFYMLQGSGTGTWKYWQINSSNAASNATVTVTNSTIQLPSSGDWNNDPNSSYIAYCFHSVSGYQKIGRYIGTGSGNSVTGLGFEPRFTLIRQITLGDQTPVHDAVRDTTNPRTAMLLLNGTISELNNSAYGISFDSDGFTLQANYTALNASGREYMYLAIA